MPTADVDPRPQSVEPPSELRRDIRALRLTFTLVPWRMRPRLILMVMGSLTVALMDMAAVSLVLPIMQIVSGSTTETSTILRVISGAVGDPALPTLLIMILIGIVVLMVAKNIFTILFRWWSLGVLARATGDASHELLRLFVSSPWVHHRRRTSAEIYQALGNYLPITLNGVVAGTISLLVDVVTVIGLLTALLIVSPLATLVAVVTFVGSALLIQSRLKRRILALGEEMRDENYQSWTFLAPVIDGFRDVRLVGAGDRMTEGYATTRARVAHITRAVSIYTELPRYLLEIVMILGIMATALVLFATSTQADAFAFLGVFAVAAVRIVPSLNRIVGNVGGVRSNLPNLHGLAEVINELRCESGRPLAPERPHVFPRSDIHFSSLEFTFPDSSTPVLNGVSGVIRAGSTVAIVGTSGAGKTTFIDLILALLNPDRGRIEVAGTSIHDHPESWQGQLGVVPQDIYLMDSTIRNNIAFGVPPEEIDEARVLRAVNLAQLSSFVEDMPDGLETIVGHRGTRISGGQKQRIGIARALYREPQVLVLDEATSALDNETEAEITRTIKDLRGTMTIVVVAHRLSTIRDADQILFFASGVIADRGTMAELTGRSPEFGELVRLGQLV